MAFRCRRRNCHSRSKQQRTAADLTCMQMSVRFDQLRRSITRPTYCVTCHKILQLAIAILRALRGRGVRSCKILCGRGARLCCPAVLAEPGRTRQKQWQSHERAQGATDRHRIPAWPSSRRRPFPWKGDTSEPSSEPCSGRKALVRGPHSPASRPSRYDQEPQVSGFTIMWISEAAS